MRKSVVSKSKEGCLLRVRVRPSSGKREFIGEITEEYVLINLKGPAREGKANAELLKRLAKCLEVSNADLAIVSGKRAREKVILVRYVSSEHILSKLLAS